ncbi:protein-tyrosine-phosphatase [Batrachochytrium dendrobatidis]|nr:protein-tyrosine-phosphatase [Batrachochytrium dendrobatidis]
MTKSQPSLSSYACRPCTPLPSIYPTYRFGTVEEDLFRGGYPKDRNHRFLARLGLKTIVSLTPEPLSEPSILKFAASNNITLVHIRVDRPKENIPLSFPKVAQILPVLIDSCSYPLYVHCLDGSLVTTLVIMCLRKLQCWSVASYRSECIRYLKEAMLSSEEAEFVTKFTGDFEISHALAARLPKWLWGNLGNTAISSTLTPASGTVSSESEAYVSLPVFPFKRHPTLKVRLPTVPLPIPLDTAVSQSTGHTTFVSDPLAASNIIQSDQSSSGLSGSMSPPSISTFIGNQQYLNSRQGSLTANQTLIPNSTSTRGSFSGVASLGYGLHRSAMEASTLRTSVANTILSTSSSVASLYNTRSSGDSRQSQFQSEGQQTESETVFNHAHSSAVMNTRILQLPELMSVVPSLERVNHSLVSSISGTFNGYALTPPPNSQLPNASIQTSPSETLAHLHTVVNDPLQARLNNESTSHSLSHSDDKPITASTTALEKEDAWRSSVNEFQTQSRSGSQTKLAYIPDILSVSTASYLRKFTHSPSASVTGNAALGGLRFNSMQQQGVTGISNNDDMSGITRGYSGNLSGSPSTMDKRSILTMNGNGNASSANAIRSSVLSIRNDGEMSDEEDEDMSRTLQALALEFGNVSRPT